MNASNQGYTYREQLGALPRGTTVLAYLAGHYRRASEEVWRERLERGEVSLDGRIASALEPLAPGQWLAWARPPWEEPEAPLHFGVLYEDEELLIASKPAGLPTMPGGGFLERTLSALVRARDPALTPMHRLGRGTSGLVLFARTARVRAALQSAFRERRVLKHYRALASGWVVAPLSIRAPIGPVAHPLLGALHAACPNGKPSSSEVLRAERRGEASLVEVEIATGRPHQIRIHLAYVGHPLVGDPLYGPGGVPAASCIALPGDLGYRLQAWRLGFHHPATGEWRLFEEEPAPELR